METENVEYRGYTIVPLPRETGELWHGGYEILRDGVRIRFREKLFPGFHYMSAARNDGIEHAKAEIDNLGPAH